MKWMKDGFKRIAHSDKEQLEFEKNNCLLVLGRIRLISWANIFLSVFWAYVDWMISNNGVDRVYIRTLIIMHMISVVACAVFLIVYHGMSKQESKNYRGLSISTKVYVFLYILFGAAASINSQRYTGNIYSYIILSLIAAIAFTLRPSYMLFAFGVNHIIFLTGIGILSNDINQFLVKMINATILAGAAYLIGFIFYRQRMLEYFVRKELVENEDNFKKLFYVNPYPVFITRMEDGKIIDANRRAYNLLGIDPEGLDRFEIIDGYIKNDTRLALQEELQENNSTYNRIVEYNVRGQQMWVTANYEVIDYHGEQCILTGIMDITEIRKAEKELTHYASIDSLTGILNRRMGYKKLEELLSKAKKTSLEFVLCFLDINNLKKINDTYGHMEGDRYIVFFCNLIKNKLQAEDVFFRMGGDEFIIIFMNNNKSQAEVIWKEYRKEFEEVNRKGELPYSISASHGLFYYQSGMEIDVDQIIEKADRQMYKEKRRHKKEFNSKAIVHPENSEERTQYTS